MSKVRGVDYRLSVIGRVRRSDGTPYCQIQVYGVTIEDLMGPVGSEPFHAALARLGLSPLEYVVSQFELWEPSHELAG